MMLPTTRQQQLFHQCLYSEKINLTCLRNIFPTLFREAEIGQTVAIRLQYYTHDENGNVIRPEDPSQYDVPVVYGDVTTSGDDDALKAFAKITEAIQEYINAKGL